jgi:outer membrane protein assembly factor BamB
VVEFFTILVILAGALWAAHHFRALRSRHAGSVGGASATSPSGSKASGFPVDRDEYFEVGNNFFCDTARSLDGRYLVGASDGHIDERGRQRRGTCALKDARTGTLCFKAAVTRGNNPHVSNDGQVIVEDWKDQNLSGALISFNRTGERIWAKHFKANIFTSGLSVNGCRAFVSTCNSDHAAHSGKTFLLDAATGEVIWSRDGWGDVRFDGDAIGVDLEAADGSKRFFPFDESGALPPAYHEAADLLRADKERGQYWAVLPKAQAALKGTPPDIAMAKQLLAELDGKEEGIPGPSRACLLRLRGELAVAEGNTAAALDLWRQALDLDPKVGIRRRYEALASKAVT